MKIIKLALISFAVFAVILTAFSLLLPSQINISKAIDINAPYDSVYTNVYRLERWNHWYADSTINSISSPSSGAGSTITFNKTKVNIVSADTNTIKGLWFSANNEPIEGTFNFIKDKSDVVTTVQW